MMRVFKHPRMKAVILFFIALVILGVFLFSHLEDWSFVDSLYFTVATLTTVGYGDLVPTTDIAKIIATIYMVLVVPMILVGIGIVAEEYVLKHKKKK